MALAASGRLLSGMKTPLINRSGNLIRVLSIWVYCGPLTGGTEKSNAIVAKQIEPTMIANISVNGFVIATPNPIAIRMGMMEMITHV